MYIYTLGMVIYNSHRACLQYIYALQVILLGVALFTLLNGDRYYGPRASEILFDNFIITL